MAYFSYVASDANGKIVKGKENADDYKDLQAKLKKNGLFCTSYKEAEIDHNKVSGYRFKLKELAFISRQISAMLTSGISLVRAMNILVSQEENKKIKAILTDVYEDIQTGRSFSDAVNARQGVFPNLFTSMVAAGEAGGNLDMVMTRVAEHYAKEQKIQNKISSAMIYPIILGVMMVGVVLALFVFIMPMFADLFTNAEDIPPLSQAIMGISDLIIDNWLIIIIVTVGVIIGFRIYLKTPLGKLNWDSLIIRMPKVGKLVCTVYTARFARTMSNLYASGMQMVYCIEKSYAVLGNSFVDIKFKDVVENVKHGESLSSAIAKTQIFEPIFTSMIFVGEESGTLDQILGTTADYYDEEADAAITKLTSMLEPVMIIILGVCVGVVLAGLFPMIYGSMSGIAK